MITRLSQSIRLATALGFTLAVLATSAQAQEIVKRGAVTGLKVEKNNGQINYANAKALPLPQGPESASVQAEQDLISNLVNRFQSSATTADSGQVAGSMGDGTASAVDREVNSEAVDTQQGPAVEPQEHGTQNHPFSTARADKTTYPFSAAGKLLFTIPGSGGSWCSASLIKRGVVVTAAHCVTSYGSGQFYTNFRFVPGNGARQWAASNVWVMSAYIFGASGQCASIAPGVICKDDVAVIELAPQTNPTFPGTTVGWLGYGWNRFGFTSSLLTHIHQLGYPAGLDNGNIMQRNASQGFIGSSSLVNNTIIGSLMDGGSSGGPWVLNFGTRPALTGVPNGSFPNPNRVIGVASWGYTNLSLKQQGASPFTSANIVPLVNAACAGGDPRCL